MTDKATDVTVTQADRDAAADFLKSDGHPFDRLWHPAVRRGERDNHILVQAFARRRHDIIESLEKGQAVDGVEWLSTKTIDRLQAYDPDHNKAGGLWYRRWRKAQDEISELRHRTASEQPASGEVMDVRPEIGASTPEPTLREIVRAYYEQEFNTQRAGELTVAYFAALSTTSEAPEAGRLREALEACLSLEKEKAEDRGFSDCCCMSYSRDTERAYEAGRCPHQHARAALASIMEQSDGR